MTCDSEIPDDIYTYVDAHGSAYLRCQSCRGELTDLFGATNFNDLVEAAETHRCDEAEGE